MNQKKHSTTEQMWQEWKDVCAADLCSASTSTALRQFGAVKFSTMVRKVLLTSNPLYPDMASIDAHHAWHLLETFVCVERSRTGKRYKDWMFRRSPDDTDNRLDALEGGAVLLMREVVREYLRREHAPAFMVSLDKPIGGGEGVALSLAELLPDRVEPLSEIDAAEWSQLAARLAEDFYPTLSSRERIVLWARSQGFALNDPRLETWAKAGGGLLYKAHRKVVDQIGTWIKRHFPDESPAAMLHLAGLMIDELGEKITATIFTEKRATQFFNKL